MAASAQSAMSDLTIVRNSESEFFDLPSELGRLSRWPIDRLPAVFGQLATLHATALLRLSTPTPAQTPDELLTVDAAAVRLGMSKEYLYRHAKQFPFTRREGRSLRFSALGIQAHIGQKNILTARQHRRNIGTV